MRKFSLAALATVFSLAPSVSHAWFFFILPGSVTNAIGDAITGSEGQNCVAPSVKVGDVFVVEGKRLVVKSLSGESARCPNPSNPIRALVVPQDDTASKQPEAPKTSDRKLASTSSFLHMNKTNAKLALPEGWRAITPTREMLVNGGVLYAENGSFGGALELRTVKSVVRGEVSDYVQSRRGYEAGQLVDGQTTQELELLINGVRAWRFEGEGHQRDASSSFDNGRAMKFVSTIFDGGDEIVELTVSAPAHEYVGKRDALLDLANNVRGLPMSTDFSTFRNNSDHSKNERASENQQRTDASAGSAQSAPSSQNSAESYQIGEMKQHTQGASARLRELKRLLDEGLITQDDYSRKKREILNSL